MSGKFDHDRDDQPPLHDGLSAAPDELLPTLADSGNLQKGAGMDTDSHGLEESEKSIPDVDEPFSAYTRREKWFIVAVSSFAGLFSPLTANVYLPAIPTIASAFHTSIELINVTITVYMVLQGVSPMLWGTISDRMGRRPLFVLCLALLSASCVGLALVPTNAYWLLVLLRCFQAAGSASTIALGSGTISDIAEPWERGGFLGASMLGSLIGPCLGPIIGGLLTGGLGWRSIFWFLTISAGAYMVFLIMVFPETLRVIVGNGSIAPPRWNRPILPILTKYDPTVATTLTPPKKFINPLLQFTHPSVVLLLVYTGMVYAVFYGVTATLSTLFADAYPFLNENELGLCFLAVGIGCAFGSVINGRMLDANFKTIERSLEKNAAKTGNVEIGPGGKRDEDKVRVAVARKLGKLDPAFPIEYARLRLMPVYVVWFASCTVGYGWSVQHRVHISCPLILQFLIGWVAVGIMSTSQTLLLDLFPTQGSSITAANNLVRCTMGATLVSIIDFILSALRPGWTYTLLALICVIMFPMILAVVKFGPRWRTRRMKQS